jgi:hypothetical protein
MGWRVWLLFWFFPFHHETGATFHKIWMSSSMDTSRPQVDVSSFGDFSKTTVYTLLISFASSV